MILITGYCFLLYVLILPALISASKSCNLAELQRLNKHLKVDTQSLTKYEWIAGQLERNCITAEPKSEDMTDVIRLANQIYYKIGLIQMSNDPVSYTHLDVYKRQVLYCLSNAASISSNR